MSVIYDGVIYAVADNGDLLWYRHEGRSDGSYKWAFNGDTKKIGSGWNYKQVFSGDNVIYAVTLSGDLLWYRHEGRTDGTWKWAFNGDTRKVGSGWNYKHVFPGNDGVIYAVTDSGDLLWYQHEGWSDGTWKWANNGAPKKVGSGWNYKQIFSGGDVGVIYAVTDSGDLLWYRHEGRGDGTWKWAYDAATKKVGSGWNFKHVFCGGLGVIYAATAVTNSGDLLWYRHEGRNDGTWKWAYDGATKKIGSGWNYKQLFCG